MGISLASAGVGGGASPTAAAAGGPGRWGLAAPPAGEDEGEVIQERGRDGEERPDRNAERAGSEDEEDQDEGERPDAEAAQHGRALGGGAPAGGGPAEKGTLSGPPRAT